MSQHSIAALYLSALLSTCLYCSLLVCGLHECPQRCHQFLDHARMKSEQIMKASCAAKHLERKQRIWNEITSLSWSAKLRQAYEYPPKAISRLRSITKGVYSAIVRMQKLDERLCRSIRLILPLCRPGEGSHSRKASECIAKPTSSQQQ